VSEERRARSAAIARADFPSLGWLYSMLDFDVNEGFIDRRANCAADCVDISAHADAPMPGRRASMTPRHDRLPGSPS
jgi:hypothetical protein